MFANKVGLGQAQTGGGGCGCSPVFPPFNNHENEQDCEGGGSGGVGELGYQIKIVFTALDYLT